MSFSNGGSGSVSLVVDGMSCESCQRHVTQALAEVPGVDKVEVILEPGSAEVWFSGDVTVDQLAQAVDEAGYVARAREGSHQES